MVKRLVLLLVLIGALLSLPIAPPSVFAAKNVQINISVRLSPVFVGLPMPSTCVAVAKSKKRFDATWTEYRVGYSIPALISFYRLQMPKHRWTALAIGRSRMIWGQGRRKIEMVFWRSPRGYTIIAVRQSKWTPPGQAKKGKKP